jgi:hypothetical protein
MFLRRFAVYPRGHNQAHRKRGRTYFYRYPGMAPTWGREVHFQGKRPQTMCGNTAHAPSIRVVESLPVRHIAHTSPRG